MSDLDLAKSESERIARFVAEVRAEAALRIHQQIVMEELKAHLEQLEGEDEAALPA